MQPTISQTGLTITNPLVLYRALLATRRIEPDEAQHRLAIHLEKLYARLKDYEPAVDYSHRLSQISSTAPRPGGHGSSAPPPPRRGFLSSMRAHRADAASMALTRQLTSHEAAARMQSPRGLLLYGEVGTGKSMLVDLLAESLPSRKKRRWHFNSFMLETFARLEGLRKERGAAGGVGGSAGGSEAVGGVVGGGEGPSPSLLLLARELVETSPIVFLDEFQLPDRAASKILSSLFTAFFQLGGVLVATSNRMPEELAKASGIEFAAPRRPGLAGLRQMIFGQGSGDGGKGLFGRQSDFADFLDVLKARCESWDMNGERDWRRREAELDRGGAKVSGDHDSAVAMDPDRLAGANGSDIASVGETALSGPEKLKSGDSIAPILPLHYHVSSSSLTPEEIKLQDDINWNTALVKAVSSPSLQASSASTIPWEATALRVYGRDLTIGKSLSGVAMWNFDDLCNANLGPADYISIASNFNTLILTDVPVLSLLHKNEARRFITLLDALYEARCKLLLRAEAGPDDIFFPETRSPAPENGASADDSTDGTYAETFSEIYQDQTSPFRPNISSYTPSASAPTYYTAPLPSSAHSNTGGDPSARSILADEDSDFGTVYGAGRSAASNTYKPPYEPGTHFKRARGAGDGAPGAGNEIGHTPDFQRTGSFTGEDERFAFKRARSRLWEMCGSRWWARAEEGWWKPLDRAARRWEGAEPMEQSVSSSELAQALNATENARVGDGGQADEKLFRHGASPFRTSQDPPPKIPGSHAWGMTTWGKKAGTWGQGVDGLKERAKESSAGSDQNGKKPDA